MINRVAIDASSASSGGAIRFLSQICPALSEANGEITCYVLNRKEQRSQLPALPHNFHWIRIPDQTAGVPYRLLWLQTALPRILTEIGADVLLAASDVSTWRPPCPMVLMAHNINPFSPLRDQIWSRKQLVRMALHRKLIKTCSQRADRVIFVSEWSRQAMLPSLDIPLGKTGIVYHGVDEIFRSFNRNTETEKTRPFVLVVSQVLEHKNFSRLIEAFIRLSRLQKEELHLVIAGGIGSEKLRKSLEARLSDEEILDRVKFLGNVTREELAALYLQAKFLVFPSLGETFGLPLIEAMASGLPVATSNVSAMPEICQDAACYFNPLDVGEIAQTMERLSVDRSLRNTLSQRGLKRSAQFSWCNSARSLLSLMEAATVKTEATK